MLGAAGCSSDAVGLMVSGRCVSAYQHCKGVLGPPTPTYHRLCKSRHVLHAVLCCAVPCLPQELPVVLDGIRLVGANDSHGRCHGWMRAHQLMLQH